MKELTNLIVTGHRTGSMLGERMTWHASLLSQPPPQEKFIFRQSAPKKKFIFRNLSKPLEFCDDLILAVDRLGKCFEN